MRGATRKPRPRPSIFNVPRRVIAGILQRCPQFHPKFCEYIHRGTDQTQRPGQHHVVKRSPKVMHNVRAAHQPASRTNNDHRACRAAEDYELASLGQRAVPIGCIYLPMRQASFSQRMDGVCTAASGSPGRYGAQKSPDINRKQLPTNHCLTSSPAYKRA